MIKEVLTFLTHLIKMCNMFFWYNYAKIKESENAPDVYIPDEKHISTASTSFLDLDTADVDSKGIGISWIFVFQMLKNTIYDILSQNKVNGKSGAFLTKRIIFHFLLGLSTNYPTTSLKINPKYI